jgi:sialate O-acetylesterase
VSTSNQRNSVQSAIRSSAAAFALVIATQAGAAPRLNPLFSDHAVLQRGPALRIFGTADAGESLTVRLGRDQRTTRADSNGRWLIQLASPTSEGALDLVVTGKGGAAARATDLLVGDVWLCSGQSNMELPVSRALNADTEIGSSADAQLRLITIDKHADTAPALDFAKPPSWSLAGPDSVGPFSAACYFMGRELRKARHIPIGLVHASWGGTAIRSWMDSRSASAAAREDAALLALYRTDAAAANRKFGQAWENWWLSIQQTRPWFNPSELSWKPMKVGYWEQWGDPAMADFNGIVWAHSRVNLTAAEAAQPATLKLGIIDEIDETWVNGIPIGSNFGWDLSRSYSVPKGLLHEGANSIVVNVVDSYGNGGFSGPDAELALQLADGTSKPLAPTLEYSVVPPNISGAPRPPWDAAAGLSLIYNGMIAPLGPLSLNGVAWYQGETDGGMAAGYAERLAGMISGWRAQFRSPALPFLIVGLPGWGAPHLAPGPSGWAEVRDAQRRVGATGGNAFVPAIDLGDRLELHPPQKQAVGGRLARAALALDRDEAASASGPQVVGAQMDGVDVLVTFRGLKGHFQSVSGEPIAFELCGADQASCRFATARIDGASIRIRRDNAPITRVRFAWADAPVVNLYDESGLPVSSFEVPVANGR